MQTTLFFGIWVGISGRSDCVLEGFGLVGPRFSRLLDGPHTSAVIGLGGTLNLFTPFVVDTLLS